VDRRENEFFDRERLEVPIVTMRGSPPTIQALTADSIYVANATVDTLERGADITMIGGLINGLGLAMVGVRTLIRITAEQGILKDPLPEPAKYIDASYLKQALSEIGKK
jgi:hypothetical protein